ncbi:MAG TPA: DUF1697 domain-containing protein [Anaerolineales bacterium]|nr:DUF1697 domain-containing protein [Anaerolineales bacterium]HNQ95873.1 DUF1697 domain-containing protein [Anaerolineales bacterium]HNS59471.1 DUF1697 domain-containing protein [Anaerolineales bacterium]
MAQTQYLALLRGINVGGNNIIKMADLKACFESLGLTDVVTYIQSGNVIFKSAEKDKAKLTKMIEAGLSKRFNYEARLVVISYKQLKQTVDDAPRGFGKELDKFKYDVIFLKEPLTAKEAMKSVSMKEGVDNGSAGKDVLYFSRLTARASSSHLTKIIGMPVYQNMTIRNWNTTTKLLALMGKE